MVFQVLPQFYCNRKNIVQQIKKTAERPKEIRRKYGHLFGFSDFTLTILHGWEDSKQYFLEKSLQGKNSVPTVGAFLI